VIDEGARHALIQRGYNNILGLRNLQSVTGLGFMETIEKFGDAYDLLNEHAQLAVDVLPGEPPHRLEDEKEWCKGAVLRTDLGNAQEAQAFGQAAARFYAYLLCRRFLDFSTSQSELVRLLEYDADALAKLRAERTHIVVDEVQDINPVQSSLIRLLAGDAGRLTAVGDHRQAIYRFRGSQVQIMAALAADLSTTDGKLFELKHNYRSTSRIVALANAWSNTIGTVGTLPNPAMQRGNDRRDDKHPSHVSLLSFTGRNDEAQWIAQTINTLVRRDRGEGAYHDTRDGDRGLTFSDIAILLRSSSDARLYMQELERAGIPAVFRAGPDLFAQPEVLLFVGALGRMVEMPVFLGAQWGTSLPARIQSVLRCQPNPDDVIRTACTVLGASGLPMKPNAADHLLRVTGLIQSRLKGEPVSGFDGITTPSLVAWLRGKNKLRRVFPQQLFQWLLAEADVQAWDTATPRSVSAMFHLGQLSKLIKGLETPGWSDPSDFKYQVIALSLWGSDNGRTDEAPLLVPPDAVMISTVHSAKGLEYPVVFLADVCSQRFPSSRARTTPSLPFGTPFQQLANVPALADNANYDDERRLMYVALTRAERYLFVSKSGSKMSQFFRELTALFPQVGGIVSTTPATVPQSVEYRPCAYDAATLRLVTSFSDLRYYLECSHDFYLRKVLGFAPTIDQAFGYGRGVHNLMRAIHSDPKRWAALDGPGLARELQGLIKQGLFYLRYTTGEPRDNMERRAVQIVSDYVRRYAGELSTLNFEPEREFETLLEAEEVLISGAIDVIRLDNPPRVTLVDFKSGHAESDVSSKLDEAEMKLQVSLYGLAAKRELEYDPKQGLVRYLAEEDKAKQELAVPLDDAALAEARKVVVDTAKLIRDRKFHAGPTRKPRDERLPSRCGECDFRAFCGQQAARDFRAPSRK
jgi:DNA helicase-2/ATP-dependent DNA helicase PcrA